LKFGVDEGRLTYWLHVDMAYDYGLVLEGDDFCDVNINFKADEPALDFGEEKS